MKIFISHSSINGDYGNALVELLRGVGLRENEIIFTSNVAYGIPLGQNIFNWLKSQIRENPYVIYLLSPAYYTSVACLNEMGAAWIIETDHTFIFTPDFKLNSAEFQNGAIDPREIGFFINNEERLLSFIDLLRTFFEISNNSVLVHQKIKEFLVKISKFNSKITSDTNKVENKTNSIIPGIEEPKTKQEVITVKTPPTISSSGYFTRFLADVDEDKLTTEELLFIYYIIDTARIKLGTGWQEDFEIQRIKEWETIKGLNNTLSTSYGSTVRRFELRKYTIVSAFTGSGNPKEVTLTEDIQEKILDFPSKLFSKIESVAQSNLKSSDFIDF